jgi:hypothetical protein
MLTDDKHTDSHNNRSFKTLHAKKRKLSKM